MKKLFLFAFAFAASFSAAAQSIYYQDKNNKDMMRHTMRNDVLRNEFILPNVNKYVVLKSDLHIHTIYSDGSVTPEYRVQEAWTDGLDVIAITDHNTTRQVKVTQQIGKENGIFVIGGVEITTQEEAHALAYFETDEQLDAFQEFLDEHLPHIPNDEERFGYQLIVDENEDVVGEEEWLLISALDVDLDTLYDKVHEIGGLFVPAHINKATSSLMSQLGFVPPDIKADALEISKHIKKNEFLRKFAYLKKFNFTIFYPIIST